MVSREWGEGLGNSERVHSDEELHGRPAGRGRYAQERRLLCGLAEFGGGFMDAHCAAKEASRVSTQRIWLWKDDAEVAGDGFGDGVQVEWLAEFLLHRGDWLRRDAAGNDQVEVAEVGVHVEGEAVGGDEAGDVDADGGEFGFGCAFVAVRRIRSLDSAGRFFESALSARDDMVAFGIGPDSGQAGDALGGDGEVGAGADQDFFEAADEFDYAQGFALGGRGVRRYTAKPRRSKMG